jgi:CHASE3 domain sensor protein
LWIRIGRYTEGDDAMSNPLQAVGNAINDGISIVVGAIILILCLIVLGAVLSIAH